MTCLRIGESSFIYQVNKIIELRRDIRYVDFMLKRHVILNKRN